MASITKGARVYRRLSRIESLSLKDVRHGCHAMLHAPVENVKLFGQIPVPNTILMQLRFDGRLGFPGGFVDASDATLEDAVNREIEEELGVIPKTAQLSENDYVMSHYCQDIRFCVHFFSKQVRFFELLQMEKRKSFQMEGGFEVLGIVRVPLFKLYDNKGGFPAFLKNNFVGISKEQLIIGIHKSNLLSSAALEGYLSGSPESHLVQDFRYENSKH